MDDVAGAEPNKSEDISDFFGRYYTRAQANVDVNAVYNAVTKDLHAASDATFYNRCSTSPTPLNTALKRPTSAR